MRFIYVLVPDAAEWEDLVLFISEEEAIKASLKHPSFRIEIFEFTKNGYVPSYNFYKNGIINKN
jgi:hypothetical protein